MKNTTSIVCCVAICLSLTACGGSKETVVHETPVVVHDNSNPNPSTIIIQDTSHMNPSSVESNCQHGYDNQSHSCY